jgi:uncharacterized membrane protein
MKKLSAYFFRGLLFLTPIGITLYILYFVFSAIDRIFRFNIPGLGFLLTLTLVTLIGFLVSTVLAQGAANVIDNLFRRMPIVKMIYSSIQDLVSAFVGDRKRFNRPVLVGLQPGSGVQLMGFVTRDSLTNIDMSESVAVYIPQSYNFAGNVIVVPKAQITPLEIESGKVMAFIVSGGVSGL